jgi:hypothetical protein
MATTTAMAVLRAMALGYCGVGSNNEDGCSDSGGKDNGNGATALVTIALVSLTITHFVSRNVVANAITCVVAVAIAFVSVG